MKKKKGFGTMIPNLLYLVTKENKRRAQKKTHQKKEKSEQKRGSFSPPFPECDTKSRTKKMRGKGEGGSGEEEFFLGDGYYFSYSIPFFAIILIKLLEWTIKV